MGEKKGFIFYRSFFDAITELDEKDRGTISYAIMQYGVTGETPNLTGYLKSMFLLIKPQIDANSNRYENGCKGAEFGKLGGRPPKEKAGEEGNKKHIEKSMENGEEGNLLNNTNGVKIETQKKPLNNPTQTPKDKEKDKDKEKEKEEEKDKVKAKEKEKDKAKEKEKRGMSKLVDLWLRDRTPATAQPTHPPTAARGFGGGRDFRGKGNGNSTPTAAVAAAGNATALSTIAKTKPQEAKPQGAKLQAFAHDKAQINPYDIAQRKALSPASELYEAFKALYQAQTHLPYNARKEDLASMETLVSRHGDHAVENKMQILHAGCKDAMFWFTRKGFSEFVIGNLIRHWNELVPFESKEEKEKRKFNELLDKIDVRKEREEWKKRWRK
jgi:hypothetical protein